MTTLSRVEARRLLYDDGEIGPALGWYGTLTGGSTSSVTDPTRFGGVNKGLTYYSGQGRLVLPGRGSTDRERDVTRLTAGGAGILGLTPALSVAAANGESYEFVRRGIRWEQLNAAWLEVLRESGVQVATPVGNVLRDSDLSGEDADAWLSSHGDLDFTYSEAAEWNNTGLQSLLLTFGGALDTRYLQQTTGFYLKAGQQVYVAGLAIMPASGEAYFSLWNDTAGAIATEQRTITGAGSWHVWEQFTAPTDGTYNVRLGGTHGLTMAWDAFPNHYLDGLYWKTPASFDQAYKLHRIDEYRYRSNTGVENVESWRTREPEAWRRHMDFTTENLREDANPNAIQVLGRETMPSRDLFYVGEARAVDSYTEGESTASKVDPETLMHGFKAKVCGLLETRDRLGPGGRWMQLKGEHEAEYALRTVTNERPSAAQHKPTQFWFGR